MIKLPNVAKSRTMKITFMLQSPRFNCQPATDRWAYEISNVDNFYLSTAFFAQNFKSIVSMIEFADVKFGNFDRTNGITP